MEHENGLAVWVDYHRRGINLYTGDFFEPYQLGVFPDCAAAQQACRRLVDEYIQDCAQPGTTVDQIMDRYADQGVAPKILSDTCHFSAHEYARHRARELAGDLWDAGTGRTHTDSVVMPLISIEIVDRIRSLGEPRTYGGLNIGGVDCIVRCEDGTSLRLLRESNCGPAQLTVVLPGGPRTPYRREERRWDHASALLQEQPAIEWGSEVDLSLRGLTELPPELWTHASDIQSLDLEGNWLREIPPEIGRLRNLRSLNVVDNRLTRLPPELGQLQSLEHLKFNGNLLSSLPTEICELSKLKTLAVSNNRLAVIPSAIWKLTALETLRLDRNALVSIPSQIGHLKRLLKLTLDHNRLGSLPPEIGALANLKDFEERVSSNKRYLPSPDELTGLSADVNPIAGDPPSLFGRKLRDHLSGQLKSRLAQIDWHAVCSEREGYAVLVPGLPVEGRVQFNECRVSIGAGSAPADLIAATATGVRRTRRRSTVEVEVEGPVEQAFSAEIDYCLDSLRTAPIEWKDHLFESSIRVHMPQVDFILRQALERALPGWKWSDGGNPNSFGLQVWGQRENMRVRLSRDPKPSGYAIAFPPMDLHVVVRAPAEYALTRDLDRLTHTVLSAVNATLVKPPEKTVEYLIAIGIPQTESNIRRSLEVALPGWTWSEGDSSWDKIRVSGENLYSYIRIYRYEEPGPFELKIVIRSTKATATATDLRDSVLRALNATLVTA